MCCCVYPFVESCLLEDLLRIWQRHSSFNADTDMNVHLDGVMDFVRKEVENKERIALAVSGCGNKPSGVSSKQVNL